MAKGKETEFDKLGRLIKGESEDIRTEMGKGFKAVGERFDKMDVRFAGIERRLDKIIQMQLDEHAGRIKKLETAVFSK